MLGWSGKKLDEFFEGSYFQELMKVSKKGATWREKMNKLDKEREVVVFEPKG
jgi:hypothetical protein